MLATFLDIGIIGLVVVYLYFWKSMRSMYQPVSLVLQNMLVIFSFFGIANNHIVFFSGILLLMLLSKDSQFLKVEKIKRKLMDNTLKVTIIVPIYNVEGYIRQSIESIIKQKYTNFEAILVDDGSTDMSYQLAKRYTQDDDRFILIQTANFGQSHARNVGLKKATGDLIAFLDPDDIYDPLFLYDAVLRFDDDTDLISYLFPKQKNV
ncbi:glycosyl transferase 2 family protein [Lactiplantibacillus plantarum subsp. plantarum]|nr:glycosyl transferase 2 family protein [Lactiplantibacillus plantarum subsp. plantarum]